MSQERKLLARSVLPSEEARETFDRLCEIFPDACVFWNTEEQTAELGLYPSAPSSVNGLKVSGVTITIG